MTETFKLETLIFFYPNILNLKLLFSFILKFKTLQTYSFQIEKTNLNYYSCAGQSFQENLYFLSFRKIEQVAHNKRFRVSGFGFVLRG